MESSLVIRGGVLLNKNKKILKNSKKTVFDQAVSLAIAGLILSSFCPPAISGDKFTGGHHNGTETYWNFNRLGNTANGGLTTNYYGNISTYNKNESVGVSGFIAVRTQLIAESGTSSYIGTYSLIGSDLSFLHLGGSVDVGQFDSRGILDDSQANLSIVVRGQLKDWSDIRHDGSDEVTKIGTATIAGTTNLKNKSSITAHNLSIEGAFNVKSTGDVTLEGKDVSLFSNGTTSEVKGKLNVSSATLTNEGNIKFKGATTFNSSSLVLNGADVSHGIMTFVDAAPTFTDSGINVGTNGGNAAYGTLVAQDTDDWSLVNEKINVYNTGSTFTAKSKNGIVEFGEIAVTGTFVADKATPVGGTASADNEGVMVLKGATKLQGDATQGGTIKASQIVVGEGVTVSTEQGKHGRIIATGDTGSEFTKAKLVTTGTMDVTGKSTFNESDLLFTGGSADVPATLTFVDNAPTFIAAGNTRNTISVGDSNGAESVATLTAAETEDWSLADVNVNVYQTQSAFTVKSKNGRVTLGDMLVHGTLAVDQATAGTSSANEGTLVLDGTATLKGNQTSGGVLTAKDIVAEQGAKVTVGTGEYGHLIASGTNAMNLTNLQTDDLKGTLTITPQGNGDKSVTVGKGFTVLDGGYLSFMGSLKAADDQSVIALNGETAAATLAAVKWDEYTGKILTGAGKYGRLDGNVSANTVDLTNATLEVDGTFDLAANTINSLTLGAANVKGVLDLTNATSINQQAAGTVVALKGADNNSKALLKLTATQGTDNKVAPLSVHATTAYNDITISGVSEADFSNLAMEVDSGAALVLSLEGQGDKTYNNIGALAQVTNKGDLRLAGQNVTFSTGALFSNSGVVSFDVAQQADRKIQTSREDFERTVANGGRFDIGSTTAYDQNNTFEITGTDNDPLDISDLLNGGSFNTDSGNGKISGDGWLKTAAAVIGSAYNDTRIGLLVDKLSSVAETISIGGLVTVAKEIAFDTAKTLNLTDNGVLTLGTDIANGDDYKFDLSRVDVNFNGGQLVAKTADGTAVTNPVDAATSHVKVKSLNFAQNAGQGSLTIKGGTKVQVVGNKDDYSQRYFNTNGNTTQGLVTLDGPGATLIVDAKDLLKATSEGYYVAWDTKSDADETPSGVIGGYGTLQIDDFIGLARHDQPNAEKPKLNINQFVQLREELIAAGVITGVTDTAGGKTYNVLIDVDKNQLDGFFDDDKNVDRGNDKTKEWLDQPIKADGDLVYNVKEDDPAKDANGKDQRQEWGAVENADGSDTLLIGVATINGAAMGTSHDVILDNAGAGKGDKATNKKYFVRYNRTDDASKNPDLGNVKFIQDEAQGTLMNGGFIGAVRTETGVKDAVLTFINSKGVATDDTQKAGFTAADVLMAGNKVVADSADVLVKAGRDASQYLGVRDKGNLETGTLVVRNDSTFTVEGTSVVDSLLFGNDAEGGKAGSTNKVDFKGDATVNKIVADGSKVTYKRDDVTGNLTTDLKDGAAGNVEVKFNTAGTNRVDAAEVADGNSLTLSGKVEVGNTKVNGTLTVADASVVLKGGLSINGTGDNVASAFIKNGSLQSAAGVGSNGKGFAYLGSTQNTLESPNTIGKNWTDSLAVLNERLPGTSYTGIGYLDENGYDISNAAINIGTVAVGTQGTLTIGTGGALIVTDQALTRPDPDKWNYTAGLKGDIANEGGTVLIGDLHKIGNQTTIKLATGNVTESDGAQWVTKNPLYTLTLKDDGILYASFNSTASDAITGKVDKDLADIIKDQGNKDQNQGGGFDKDRKDGNGFISKVLDDTVTNENGVDFDATADRIGKTLTSSTRFAVLGGAAQNSQLASDMVTAQIEERAGFRTSTASRMTTDNGEAGSLWVNPLYNKNRSGHLNAGHYTYGLDADLYGMSFGGDVAVNDTFRIGAAFSGGKGNSDAVGGLMPTKNDFDFYSGSLYAITDIGSVTLLTDLDYTWLKGDVKQTNRITTLNSTLKSDVTSFGVSAKRTFEVNNGTLVAPYAGVRVNRLHINGYDVKDTDGNTIITAESQQQYYATVPVGVQVSKNIELTNGFVKPVLDLGLVTTLGSRHMESRVTYTGFGETSATSEVRDRTAFTVKFGVNAEVGNLGLGLGYGLTGSQSLTSNQVYGNVRYRF